MRAYLHSRKWALGYGALLAVLLLLPYAAAWQAQGEAWRFSGFLLGVEDGNSYIAKMLTGTAGAWLFHPPYTTWQVAPMPVFLPYIWLGKLAAGTALHLQLVVLYHLVRSLAVVLAVLATYDFASLFVETETDRHWVTVLATVGGGLGVWAVLMGVEVGWGGALCCYSPEAFGFLAEVFLLHVTFAYALMLWLLRALWLENLSWRGSVAALVLLALFQPLSLGVFLASWGVMFGWRTLLRRQPVVKGLVLPAAALLIAGLYALLPVLHPYARVWAQQNIVTAQSVWHYIWAYAWLWPLAVLGGIVVWRRGQREAIWVVVWSLVFPAFAYLPVTNARRLVEGGWLALLIAAAWGLRALPTRWARGLKYAIGGLSLVPFGVMFAMLIQAAQHPRPPVFLPREEVTAFRKLAAEASVGDGVLAAFPTANALPAWAPVRVIDGLGTESPHFHDALREVKKFYSADADDGWRRAFLKRHRLRWVFWGDAERALGDWDPHEADFLCLHYEKGGYSFWRVCVDNP